VRLLHAALPPTDSYLARALAEAGHVVDAAEDLPDLLLVAAGGGYDAVVVELAAATSDVAAIAAAAGRAVVVAVVDRATPAERAAMLRDGVDAVFARPVHFMELEARLTALARLAPRIEAGPDAFGLDPASRAARAGGRSVALSMREYALLDYLLGRPGEVVGVEQLLEHVWGDAADAGPERLRTALARLRGKLNAAFGQPMIATVRGHGYRLDAKMKLSSSS
jgi:two-component system OmpR family response regulator